MSSQSRSRLLRVAILVVAGVLWTFAHGKWIIPAASWLAPILMLYFVRQSKLSYGPLAAATTVAAATYLSFEGVIPLDGIGYPAFCIGFGIFITIPMLLDRWLTSKRNDFFSTLVFPSAYVAFEFAATAFSPFGSWGSWAYTQYENLSLMQLARFTGLWGITFLMMWGASTANWAWENRGRIQAIRKRLLVYPLLLLFLMLGGSAQLVALRPESPTVRVASLSLHDIDGFKSRASLAVRGKLDEGELEIFRAQSIRNQNDLLERTRFEARAGARIVVWAESNAPVLESDMPDFMKRAGAVAKEEGIYLLAGVGEVKASKHVRDEIKQLTFDPNGNLVDTYLKTIQVPGWEAATFASGDGIHVIDTEYGRLGIAICFDADHPSLIRKAGKQGVDMMIVPSNEWAELDPLHTHMAAVRAIENGFSLLRHTSGSYSLAVDSQGRELGGMHHATSVDRTLVVQMNRQGLGGSLYVHFGDWFAFSSIVLLAALVATSFRKNQTLEESVKI